MKKYEHLWRRYPPDTAAASSSWESPEPLQLQASTQLQTVQTLREWEQEEIHAVNRMTMDLLSTTADMESHMMEDDPISDVASLHDAAEVTLERPTKYGRCPRHRCVLYPHLHRHKESTLWGTVYLRCAQFKDRQADGRPGCWYKRALSSQELDSLPKSVVRARAEIRKDIAWQLRNPR
jgi:hypothetical protein